MTAFFGCIIQYPSTTGEIFNYKKFIENAKENNCIVTMATDLLALTLLEPPGELGADIAIGSSQRFGVPMGYGGPHAGFFAVTSKLQRKIPGRVVGVSKDGLGNQAYRLALQTREQHIRREKATSNICTAQALLANMASMYAVYHGPSRLKNIAEKIHTYTCMLNESLINLGFAVHTKSFFDTITVGVSKSQFESIKQISKEKKINFRLYSDCERVGISLHELCKQENIKDIILCFSCSSEGHVNINDSSFESTIPLSLRRKSKYLKHPVFNSYHSETEMMRYLKRLENKDLSLTSSMIPLGSCTMKLNSASQMTPLVWPGFADMHPFAPVSQAKGYQKLISELESF